MHIPATEVLWHDAATIAAFAIFVATYLFIAVGKLPGYHLDRAGAALLGASLMVYARHEADLPAFFPKSGVTRHALSGDTPRYATCRSMVGARL